MNHHLRHIALVGVALLVVIIECYKLNMPIPVSDAAYTVYATNYLTMTSLSFIILGAIVMATTGNKWVIACMEGLMLLHAYFIVKQKIGFTGQHHWFDWVFMSTSILIIGLTLIDKRKKV